MQKFLAKYGLAAHLALVVVAPLFLSPTAVIWLSALAVVWFLMEPSRIGYEQLHEARHRVYARILRDSLFWVFLALTVISGVRFANGGVTLAYDAETAKWSISSPVISFLPGSVDGSGYPAFAGVVAACVAVVAGRHALGRSARLAFLLVSSALSALGAAVMIVMSMGSDISALQSMAAHFENPVFIGSVFGVHLSAAVSVLLSAFEKRWFKIMPIAAFAVGGNALGLFAFAPPLMHCIFGAAALIVFLYSFVYGRLRLLSRGEFKYLVVFGLSLAMAYMVSTVSVVGDTLEAKIAPYVTGEFLTGDFMSLRGVLSSIALDIWKESPWFGGGLGSFAMELGFHATKDQWEVIPSVQNAPLNGYWLLLSERGIVGVFLMAVPAVMMLGFYVRRMVAGVVRTLPEPTAWVGLLVAAAAVAEAFFDVTPFSPAMLVAVAAYLSVSTSAFPKEK